MTQDELLAKVKGLGCPGAFFLPDDFDDEPPLPISVNCNDVFAWACADLEEITETNLPELEKAIKDAGDWGPTLFAARIRKMRPQRPCMKNMPDNIRELFFSAGPERSIESEG